MGAQTASFCLLVSRAKPMVGVWEEAIPPTIVAITNKLRQRVEKGAARVSKAGRVCPAASGRPPGPFIYRRELEARNRRAARKVRAARRLRASGVGPRDGSGAARAQAMMQALS